MKVAVIGSRETGDLTLFELLDEIPRNCTQIISGGAKGVDAMARECAGRLGVPCIEFLPDYKRYGKLAPLKRNVEIVSHADLVLAFWNFTSHGTRHAILECQKRGIPCKIIDVRKDGFKHLKLRSPESRAVLGDGEKVR